MTTGWRSVLAWGWAAIAAAAAPENLLRNGSFEGGLLYWHNVDTNKQSLVRGDATAGEYALRIDGGYVMSAPFVAERGGRYTLSFDVRGAKPGRVRASMPPSAREDGQRSKRLWSREGAQSAPISTNWQRVAFAWPADVPPSGFWPNPHYMVLIEPDGGGTIFVDGATVTAGAAAPPAYVPRRDLEIVAECLDLPAYEGASASLFEPGAVVCVAAHASNPGAADREAVLRWQLIDYEGIEPVGEAVEKTVKIPAGKTVSDTAPLKLTANGVVLARVSVHPAAGGAAIDSSDHPVGSLPYPKAATKPDWRERFGGSFAGGPGCVRKFQRLGFGWIRWRPHANGEDHLPKAPAPGAPWEWTWFDRELDEQEAHGCSAHLVLYPPPKWIMEKGHPLPTDMRWAPGDPRWNDLSVETTWDRFVREAVAHYRGRSVVYEIENEPEFDKWDNLKDEYAAFTIRTAKLIRKTDPAAKIMVDNVYGIPSGVNAAFLRAGGAKHIDIFSWHDYHEGWLADASAIRRMRRNLDEAGGQHVEIWFNEGWAFSNTAVDEPIACTRLTSAQSFNAIMDSVAELTVNGQEKTILFHTAYEKHGMSFWDYSGPGTMLWDWYNFPLPIAAGWNVLAHHIGVSEAVGFVRPPGANFCIFDDLRNGRGVMVAYADRDAKEDARVDLPDAGSPFTAEDLMGNAKPAPGTLVLSKTGRPVLLYTAAKTPGRAFLETFAPLDRKHAGFVRAGADGGAEYRLPAAWEGSRKGSADGNPISANGRPVWRIDRVYPSDPAIAANYGAVPWNGTEWHPEDHQQGGQPAVKVENGTARLSVSGPWKSHEFQKIAGIVFIAPESGVYRATATARSKPWTGEAKSFRLAVLKKDAQRAAVVKTFDLPRDNSPVAVDVEAELTDGHELVFLPLVPDWHNATATALEDLAIRKTK